MVCIRSLYTVVWTTFYNPSEEGAHHLFPYSTGTKVQRVESFAESPVPLGIQGPIVARWHIVLFLQGVCLSAMIGLIYCFDGHVPG
jgi:hypothetical protein